MKKKQLKNSLMDQPEIAGIYSAYQSEKLSSFSKSWASRWQPELNVYTKPILSIPLYWIEILTSN